MSRSSDAEFLAEIPAQFAGLYEVVPQARIRELLETDDDRYRAVLSDFKGCANAGLFVQQVLAWLERTYPDRLRYVDETLVERVVVGGETGSEPRGGGGVVVHARGHQVSAGHVVLCTNGFTDHVIEDELGVPIRLHERQQIVGTIGYMAAFFEERMRAPAAMSYIRNVEIGGDVPYVYVTRRTYDRPVAGSGPASMAPATLTCMGGPEWPIQGETALRRMIEATFKLWHGAWPFVEFSERARRTDAEMGRVFREIDGYRLGNLRSIADQIALEGRLRADIDAAAAGDLAFALSTPSTYGELVRVRGWSLEQATAIVTRSIVAGFIDAATRATPGPPADWSSALRPSAAIGLSSSGQAPGD